MVVWFLHQISVLDSLSVNRVGLGHTRWMGTQGIKDSSASWKHFSLRIWWFSLCTGYLNLPSASNTILCHWKYSNKAIYTTASITCGWAGGVTQMWWPLGGNSHCMTHGRTEGWRDGHWTDGWTDGQTNRLTDRQTYRPTDLQTDRPTDHRIDGPTDQWTDRHMCSEQISAQLSSAQLFL